MKPITAIALQLAVAFLIVSCNDSPTDAGLAGTPLEPAAVVETTSPVEFLPIDFGPAVGESTIRRNANGASMTLQTSGLTPGNAYTVWWVVFGNPENCVQLMGEPMPCGADDLSRAGVNGGFTRAAGHVIGGSGKGYFGSSLKVGDLLPNTGNTFDDVLGSEIHLVVRTHGQALPGLVDEQTHELNGGCNPACTNIQGSIHPVP